MNLRQLRSFVQVAELGSLSKAATTLFTVQSAISRQIKALEEELQTKLFIRHGRGLQLTDSGRLFLDRAVHILKEVEEAKSEILGGNEIISGMVTIGMPPTVSSVLAGSLAERMALQYPNIKLRFVDAFSETLLKKLQQREIDFAIIYDHKTHHNLRIYPLVLENLHLVMNPENKLSNRESVTFEEMTSETLVLPSSEHSLRRLIENVASTENVELKVSIDTDGLTTLKEMVMRGIGSTILPLPSVLREVNEGAVCVTQIINPSITRKLLLALPIDRPCTNASLKASELLRMQVKQLVESGTWSGQLLIPPEEDEE